ncbi:hypothetical protein ACFWUW_10945 [Streptomyces sp. NPDC058655]|uniref:hypothetical protein n=1 Tax=unclassified Streptomyces TaxID=2593676 RepID=UPI0036692676
MFGSLGHKWVLEDPLADDALARWYVDWLEGGAHCTPAIHERLTLDVGVHGTASSARVSA